MKQSWSFLAPYRNAALTFTGILPAQVSLRAPRKRGVAISIWLWLAQEVTEITSSAAPPRNDTRANHSRIIPAMSLRTERSGARQSHL